MSKESILVIEDEAAVSELLRYNLEKEGYLVYLADTGEKGLELASKLKPDAILLDLMLPHIDGLEVCRLLKQTRETRRIPVLMVTAKSSEVDQVVGLEMGAADYLTKPFSVKVLGARLKNVLRKSQDGAKEREALRRGDFLLDPDSVRLSVKGKPVELTRTEFGILAALMERPDVVMSRGQIIAAVWGAGSIVSSASVNMQIKSLRDKLGKSGSAIQTVRGLGYRFTNGPAG